VKNIDELVIEVGEAENWIKWKKEQINKFTEELKYGVGQAEILKEKIANHMKDRGTDHLNVCGKTLTTKETVTIEIVNKKAIPHNFLREKPATFEPNKRKIRTAITLGESVPGASAIKTINLKIEEGVK